ncbi:MAG: RadC family protein [Mangrovibacterium sp.]
MDSIKTDASRLSIKDWAIDDRPREKLALQGARSLSDAELLAIVLGSGSRNETAVELARRILSSVDNNLVELGRCDMKQLMKFKGVGEAKAVNVIAVAELARRRKEQESTKRVIISKSADVAEVFSPLLEDLPVEEFWVAILSQSNKVLGKQQISSGGISGTVVDVRIILKYAIENMATGIVLCHNHPSGNLIPSDADKHLTQKIVQAANHLDIRVLDHIIIAHQKYFSFSDEGLL